MNEILKARLEIAEKVNKFVNGKVWSKGNSVRIYLLAGYLSIEKDDKSINIDPIKRSHFMRTKKLLIDNGYTTYRG